MINREQVFRLSTLALLSVMFVAVSAIAEKEEKVQPKEDINPLSTISLLNEAELINSGAFNPQNLTQFGTQK